MSIITSIQEFVSNIFKKEPKKLTFIIGEDFYKKTKIPDLQDRNAYWDSHPIEEIADLDSYIKDPTPFYDFYNNKKEEFKAISPSSIHKEIAKLKDEYEVSIITLSVDNLFERVGAKKVIHINGSIFEYYCDHTFGGCSKIFKLKDNWSKSTECPRCGETHTVRPNIVWYKQDSEFSAWKDACLAVENCDLLIQIGADANDHLVEALLAKCYSNKLEINRRTTDPDEMIFEFVMEGDIKKNIQEMKKKLKKYVSYKKPAIQQTDDDKPKKKKRK